MKIHLPVGLRKALLACLAAIALPATLSATLGTASGVAAAWLAISYVANEPVHAAFAGPSDVTYTDMQWATEGDAVSKMTITGDTNVQLDGTHPAWSGNGEARHQMEYVLGAETQSGTVNLKLTSGDQPDTQYWFKNVGAFKSLWMDGVGRWFIKDSTESFSNQIEDIYISGSQLYIDSSATEITDWKANIHIGGSRAVGDEGAFVAQKNFATTGALDVVENAKITFGSNAEEGAVTVDMSFGSISGGGVLEIKDSSNGTLTLTGGGSVGGIHSSGANANITFGGTLTLGAEASNIAGTLTVNAGGNLTLGGQLTVGAVSGTINQLTLNNGAEFGVNSGSLTIGELILGAEGGSLALDVTQSAQLTLTTLTANSYHLTIYLTGLTDELIGTDGYALFGGTGWNSTWSDFITVESESGRRLKVNEGGKLVWANVAEITDQPSFTTAAADETQNAEGQTWDINVAEGTQFYFKGKPGDANATASVVNANLNFLQTLTINQGYNNQNQTFNGNFTGGEDVDMIFKGWVTEGTVATNTWKFYGDLTGFEGSIRGTAGTLNVEFEEGSKSNKGAILRDGGTVNLTLNGQSMNNSTITVNNLTVNGAVEFAGNSQVDVVGTVTFSSGASLTLGTSTRVALGTIALGSTLTSLDMGDGAILTVGSGALTATRLTTNGDVTIGAAYRGTLNINSWEGTGTLTIDLSMLGSVGETFQLFDQTNTWIQSVKDRIHFIGKDGVTLNDDGTITIANGGEAANAVISDTATFRASAVDSSKNVRGQLWDINVAHGTDFWFQGAPGDQDDTQTNASWDSVIHADLNIVQTLTVTNGSNERTQTFNGAIKGREGVDLVLKWGDHTNTWQFNGSLAGFAGDILATAGTLNVVFGDGAESNTGAIKQDGGTLNLTINGQNMANDEISVNGLTVNGSVSFAAESHVTAAGTTTFGTVAAGPEIAAAIDAAGAPILTLNAGTRLDMQTVQGTLDILKMGDGSNFTVGATSPDSPFVIGSIDTTPATQTAPTLTLGNNTSVSVTGTITGTEGKELKVDMGAGATLSLGADATLGGINGADADARHLTGTKEGSNVILTFDNAEGAEDSLVHVEVSGIDIVKKGAGSQNLSMRFIGGSIRVESGTLSTIGGQHWSTLDATSVYIAAGAIFFWGDALKIEGSSDSRPGYVSGDVDIQGTFRIQDSINFAKGATIGDSGKIITEWGAKIGFGSDLIINHATDVFENGGYGIATLQKADIEGAAEHVHLQLGGEGQNYCIAENAWGKVHGSTLTGGNVINIDSSLGLYWKGTGQMYVTSSELDEVLVGGSGVLWFQGQVTLNGELKDAEGYEGEANVFVHNADNARLTLKAGGSLKSVLNGGWGTYIDLGADFEVGGLQLKDASGKENVGAGEYKFARAADTEEDVTLRLNVTSDVTLSNSNTLTLDEGVNLVKEGSATQTITGLLTADGNVTVNEGKLELSGGGMVSGALTGEGTLKTSAQTLTLSGGGNFSGTIELAGGTLAVSENALSVGTLTISGASTLDVQSNLTITKLSGDAGLTELSIAGGMTLTVSSGNLSIDGTWTWKAGSILKLEKAGQTITLGEGLATLNGGSGTPQLTIDLTEEFLKPGGDKGGNGKVQLFASGMKEEWVDYFRFTVGGVEVGGEGNYKDLGLNAAGVLWWGIADLYWGGVDGEDNLTWDTEGASFDTAENGGTKTKWTSGAPINFVAANGEHTVTLKQSVETGEFTASKGATTYNFVSGTGSTIKLEVNGGITTMDGAMLSFDKDVQLAVKKDINLGAGSTLTLGADMVFGGTITGEGSVKAADGASVYALWDAGSASEVTWGEFEGHFGNALDARVGYGVSMSGANLSISGAAALGHNFKVAGTSKTLTFTGALNMDAHTVEVAEGATLALGGGGSGSGSLTGAGGVKFTGEDFSFTGEIGIRSIEVSGGNLSLTDGVSFTGSEQTILVSGGGKLTLGMTDAEAMQSVSVQLAGTSAETENLHLNKSATLGKLWGTGKVTMEGGCSLTIAGQAGENEVFTGQIAGETEVTGVFRLGNGALIGNTTTVTGTLNVQGGSSATVNTLHVGSGGKVDIAGGATLTVGTELAGDGGAYGTISGAGTLKVTCGGAYGGAISVTNLTYAGDTKTLELSGAVTSENIRVESGTLKVSGDGELKTVTIAGGMLEAGAANGLSIASLAIEGAAGLKVTQNLTLASVTGSAALSSLEIGAGDNLTITTGNLALNGTLSWGSGAVLTLGDDSEQKIIWGEGFSFGEGNVEGKLTVHLSDAYLKGLTNHEDSFVELNGLTWDSSWKDRFTIITDVGSKYHDLGMEDDGDLYWERDGVKWDGGSDGTWSDTGDQGWNEVEGDDPAKQEPSKQDVYFKEDSDAPSDVKIDPAGVNPANVYVESGDYTFTGGGLNIAWDGVLAVGGTKDMARLALKNANTSIPAIELQKNGTLALEAEGAVPENTKIKFMGGTLEIGQVGTDVSEKVAELGEGSTDIAKVKVGEGQNAKWGDKEKEITGNSGLTLILDEKGLEKTGAGNFTLAWKETTGTEHVGALTVTEGTLTLDVNTDAGNAVMSREISGDGTLKVSGGNITLSGANTVKHIELAGGNTTLGNGNALGNEQTELTLSGGNITSSDAGNTVSAGVVQVTEGTTSTVTGTVTFNGDVTRNGTLAAASNATVTLAGSVNGFTGTLDTGEKGTITLSGAEGEVGASAAGNGTLEVKSGKGVTLTGQLGNGGTLTVQNSGSGKLVIAGNVAAGTSWSFGNTEDVGNIVFGDAGHAVNLTGASSVTGKGTVVLANVTLKDFEKGEAKLVVDTAFPTSVARTVSTETTGQGGIVDVGGMAAGNLDGITVHAGGLLKGVSGVYTVSKDKAPLTLHFTETNWGNEGEGKALIEGATGDFRIDLSSGDAVNQGLQLGFKADVIEWFRTHDELYLRVLGSGTWKTDGVSIDWTKMTDTTAQILNLVVGQNYQFTADGLKLTGSTKDMYLVTGEEYGDSPNSSSPDDFSGKLATVVTNEQTLTLKWAEDGTVNNLLGTEGTQLVIQDVGGKGITVTLDNTYHDPLRDDRYPENTEAKGQDTTFEGSITGGDGVDIVKSGLGKLTVGGNYTLEDGDTRIVAGALELGGGVNEMGSLTFAYGAAPGEGEQRGVFLDGGQTVIGRIEEAADAVSTDGNEVNIANGAGLNLTGQSTLAHTGITGDGSGTLKLADGAGLTFTGTEGIKGVAVNLEGERSTLDLGATQSELTNLTGKGTLKSTAGGNVSVGGGIFSGTLDGTGGGTLTVADNASVTLDNVKGTDMNVQLQGKGSTLIVKVDGKKGDGTDTLKFGDVHIGDGHLTLDYGKKSLTQNFVQGKIGRIGEGMIEFHSDDPVANGDVYTGFSVNPDGNWNDFIDRHVKFTGLGNFMKEHEARVDEAGNLMLKTKDAVENKFEREIPGAGKNAHAGARMLWESLRDLSPTDAFFELMSNPTSDYAHLVYTLVSAIDNGQTTGLERTLTSVAGASISTLTPALAQDIHRQLTTIRNRTTGMSAEVPTDGYDEFPFWHAWIQAEGGYHKMDADGMEPGFTLHNWGGTVGVDADISRATTMGLAVTAMYGDLKPDAADSATGDLDTVYLSAFARTMRGAWSHTFVLSGGIADAKLDRTVSYNGGSYRTRGDTDGYVVGALYEVGYTRLVNKEGTVALQPIANVELRHTSLRGYTEKGSDAGVDVDDMDMTVLTLGAGARVQAAVGENAFNRSTVLEARLLAKADIGDRSGTATNAIVGHSKRAEVESAEVGAVGIETGIGISIPLGSQSGSIFADASLEWRDNWVSTNATLGYRINF